MSACYIPPVTLTLVHSALQQRSASALPLDHAARVCELMHAGVALGKYSPAGASQCYGGIDPPPPPPPPGEGEEDLPVAFRDLDSNDDGCISEDEFDESDPPPNLVFVTVVSTVSNDGCPEEISEADFDALLQQMQGGGADLGGGTDPGGDPRLASGVLFVVHTNRQPYYALG